MSSRYNYLSLRKHLFDRRSYFNDIADRPAGEIVLPYPPPSPRLSIINEDEAGATAVQASRNSVQRRL